MISINTNALVSLCFNIGPAAFDGSTVLKHLNANPNDPTIKQAFKAWEFASGKPILLARRKRACAIQIKLSNNISFDIT